MTTSCLQHQKNAETFEESYVVIESDSLRATQEYLSDLELGFGTEYEKVILTEIITQISEKYGIKSALNFPKNKLLGNPHDVTKGLKEKLFSPDLLWNFCEFENEASTIEFFTHIDAFNPQYILIVTQNLRNPGVFIHFAYHKMFAKKWDHGQFVKMSTKSIEKFSKCTKKYEVIEKGLFDAPWFILDVYETGKYLKKLIPETSQSAKHTSKSVFERSSTSFKKWASHHNYILLKRL
jgi:hypothetical protein